MKAAVNSAPESKSEAHIQFLKWFEDFKKAQEFREENEAQTWAKKWWGQLDWNLRSCLLVMVCGDMAERYQGLMWAGLPIDVREDIMLCGRTIERSFRGAPWR